MADEKPRWEKMSKSKGNVISVDEVVYGVANVDPRYEFRSPDGDVIDWKELCVWRNPDPADNFYYTAVRFGRMPVFLHEAGNPVPALFLIDGEERVQHPRRAAIWHGILERHPEGRGQYGLEYYGLKTPDGKLVSYEPRRVCGNPGDYGGEAGPLGEGRPDTEQGDGQPDAGGSGPTDPAH